MKALLALVALGGCLPTSASGAEVNGALTCWSQAVPPAALFARRVCDRREQELLDDLRANRRSVDAAKAEIFAARAQCDRLRAQFDQARALHTKALKLFEKGDDAGARAALEALRDLLSTYGSPP